MAKQKAEHRPSWWRRTWVRGLFWLAGFFVAGLVVIAYLNTFVFTPIKDAQWGVSFSVKQARDLGLDWKANYLALLNDLNFKHLRLMSYWDESEATRGQFDFTDLDWQFQQAQAHGAKISLAIGLRQPRWPECHEPAWAFALKGNAWKQALYAYMQVVVNRYKNNPALDTYQLENEGMNNWFGTCDAPDRQRLIEEFNLVKQWDPTHKIIMSLSDEHGIPLGQPVPDIYGFSVYRTVWNNKFPPHGYINYPTPVWYHRLRAAVIQAVQHRPIIIHELQMEPWGPVDTKNLTVTEQDQSMNADQIISNFHFARQIGIKEMYLWGGEWWYWRMVHGDPSIWNTVKAQLQNP